VAPSAIQKGGGKNCSRLCDNRSSDRYLRAVSRLRTSNERNGVWTAAMLRRFSEWSDPVACAFPLCQNPQAKSANKSKWNLCSLHRKRLNGALTKRRRRIKDIHKENL